MKVQLNQEVMELGCPKGTYINISDGDDALAHKDILEHSLYIAQKGNLDVTEFSAAYFKKNLKL